MVAEPAKCSKRVIPPDPLQSWHAVQSFAKPAHHCNLARTGTHITGITAD